MIELRDVRFAYDESAILRGVDLQIDDGELVLVAGRTGIGKSTLLGVFNGLVPSFTGGTLCGDVLIDGESVMHLAPRDRAHLVGYVGQDPLSGFVTDSVEEELAFGPEQLGLDAATMRRRVEETLDLLGLAHLRHRDLRTLSGGQQQRVAIGAVLTMHPRILVLDEPTSALDPTAAEEVLATLTRLVNDVGLTVVVAEHRLERVVPFADLMILLDGDGTLTVGEPADVLRKSAVAPPIVQLGRLLAWDPLPLSVRDARRRARALGTPARLNACSSVQDGPLNGPEVTTRRARGDGSMELVRVDRLHVSYGRRSAVREVSLSLDEGGVTALMGRNGSGKSTLLWAMQGSGPCDSGTVSIAGSTLDPAARTRQIGLVPQTPADLLYLETVAEECATADADHAGMQMPAALDLLQRLAPGIDPHMHPRDLSEGQRLALVLAIVLRAGPRVILLDEPTRGLDYPGKQALVEIIRELVAEGRAALVASHDVEFVAQVADRVVVLAEGEVVAAGPTAEVLSQTPAFAPQVHKILGGDWLTVAQVAEALA